ncbi:unnamed protein product [Tuber aestivum]|uniref:SWIRM domain-containing protein n=1 Tax=Tuber aestivum TaxID=59557 RepID=A0A292Q344_9PEZI|nr:unnamed protein product [Tuber aestivum]
MEATPTSSSKNPSAINSFLASPAEIPSSHFRLPSPTPPDQPHMLAPGIRLQGVHKMSIAAATNPTLLLSPPPSPANRRLSSPPTSSPPSIVDRPLFPAQTDSSISLEIPLFQVSERFEPMIQDAIASVDHTFRRGVQRKTKIEPTPEEYNLFVSSAWRLCQSGPKEWLRQENEYLRCIDVARKAAANRIQKTSALGPRQRLAPRPHQSSLTRPRTQARRPRTPKPSSNAIDGFASSDGRFPTPTSQTSGSASIRARAVAPREDTDFESIPDMSPQIETLDHLKPLKADWKGTALDLSNDPHLDLLHPSEVVLASTLRLSCASYLTSKRRIFQDRVDKAMQHKEFRKTDAQKACRIDVNKASKLWAAFEKVGWLDLKHIMKYIR